MPAHPGARRNPAQQRAAQRQHEGHVLAGQCRLGRTCSLRAPECYGVAEIGEVEIRKVLGRAVLVATLAATGVGLVGAPASAERRAKPRARLLGFDRPVRRASEEVQVGSSEDVDVTIARLLAGLGQAQAG